MLLTDRLHLRPWRDADLPALTQLCADPQTMKHFPAPLSAGESRAFLQRLQAHQAEHGYSYFAAEERASGRVIGFVGLARQTFEASFTPATDIGWRLLPEFWGRGYATEGARACLAFAFADLQLDEVIAVAVRQNLPSIRVMEKIGLTFGEEFRHPALVDHPGLEACVLYRGNAECVSER